MQQQFISNSEIEARLVALRREYIEGKSMLADIEQKRSNLKSQLLRINGAMQVLEELILEQSNIRDLKSAHQQ